MTQVQDPAWKHCDEVPSEVQVGTEHSYAFWDFKEKQISLQ